LLLFAVQPNSCNSVYRINEVMLHRAQLVLLLVMTSIPVFIQSTQAHSAWPSLRG